MQWTNKSPFFEETVELLILLYSSRFFIVTLLYVFSLSDVPHAPVVVSLNLFKCLH